MNDRVIPYGRQHISGDDISAVVDVLKSDYLTQGPKIKEFEEEFARYVGSKFAVAVSNGTAALHLGALALNLKAGQKVITTPITFAASANCVRYCGAEVVFSDIDPATYLIDLNKVERLLERGKPGEYVGIIPVNFAGRPVNLEELKKLAIKYEVWVMEDACHSPGAFFLDQENKSQNSGNGEFAELSIFSFHPVKHIAAGEGGMITTNSQMLYERLLKLRSHGISREVSSFENPIELASGTQDSLQLSDWPGWYMEMQEIGYNYRLSDFQAALGLSQLLRADQGLQRRKEIALNYEKKLTPLKSLKGMSGFVEGHAYHLYVIEVDDRLGLYNFLRSKRIFAQVHYVPTHIMPYYQSLGWKIGDMQHAEYYYRNCLSLPMYPTLSDGDQEYVIQSIFEYYGQ